MPRGRKPPKNQDVLVRSAEMLGWALGGLEREISQTRERLASLTAQAAKLRARVGSGRGGAAAAAEGTPAPAKTGRKRRKMTAEGRKRISDLMKKRWADTKKAGKRRLG